MTQPRAILFDIGETLIHFAGIDRLAAFRAGAAAGHACLRSQGIRLPPRDAFVRAMVWRGRKAMLVNRLSRREIDIDLMFQWVTGDLGRRMGPQVWREFILRTYRPLADASRVDPQAVEVLTALRRAGVALAVVSNTFVSHFAIDAHLERVGLLGLFEHRFYSGQIGLKKPSLTLFRHALRTLNVKPAQAWHVGNDLIADILGAQRAGITAVLRLPPGSPPNRRVPWWWPFHRPLVIHELAELPNLVKSSNHEGTRDRKLPAWRN